MCSFTVLTCIDEDQCSEQRHLLFSQSQRTQIVSKVKYSSY